MVSNRVAENHFFEAKWIQHFFLKENSTILNINDFLFTNLNVWSLHFKSVQLLRIISYVKDEIFARLENLKHIFGLFHPLSSRELSVLPQAFHDLEVISLLISQSSEADQFRHKKNK